MFSFVNLKRQFERIAWLESRVQQLERDENSGGRVRRREKDSVIK